MACGREGITKRAIIGTGCLVVAVLGALILYLVYFIPSQQIPDDETSVQRAQRVLAQMPIFDGHNAFPFNLRQLLYNDLRKVDFNSDLTKVEPWKSSNRSRTDLLRLHQGRVGALFWLANTRCNSQHKDSVEQTLEQIDTIKRLVDEYSDHLQWATSAAGVEKAIANGKIASLIGVEGGHSIHSSFGILRVLYSIGARYLTLTNICNTPWADSSDDNLLEPQRGGLTSFGLKIVDEMNRLGMMVDISHGSYATMKSALINSKAPVIFSHSSVQALCNSHRNIHDDLLPLIKDKGALILINFNANCYSERNTTIDDIVAQLNYIKEKTGADNIGLGADYDGVTAMPVGLEDVSKYPDLFAKLIETGVWSDEDLVKLAGKNLLRVMRKAEEVRDHMKGEPLHQDTISLHELSNRRVNMSCFTSKFP